MSQSDLFLTMAVLVTLQWVMFLIIGIKMWVMTKWLKLLSDEVDGIRRPRQRPGGYEYNCTRDDLAEYCP